MFALQFNKLKESLSIQLLLFPTIQHEKNKRLFKKYIYINFVLKYIYTLKEETFAGRNFPGFAVLAKFDKVFSLEIFAKTSSEKVSSREISKSLHPRKFIPVKFSNKKVVICEYSEIQLLFSRKKWIVWSKNYMSYFAEFSLAVFQPTIKATQNRRNSQKS